ncbi:MAG: O-antigen ligase family protein [Planctomycetota bacterium]
MRIGPLYPPGWSGALPLSAASEAALPRPLLGAEERKPVSLYPIMVGLVFFFMAIELPYRSIHIPQPIMIALGILSFFTIVVLAFENFFLVMLLLVSYLPFSSLLPGDFGGFLTAFNLTNILTVVVLVGWLARRAFRDEPFYRPTRADALLGLFCALASVSLIRSSIEGHTNEHILFTLKRYLTPFLYFYIFANNVRRKKEIEYILVTTAFIAFVAAVMGLKESYMDIGPFGDLDSMRMRGITQQSNDTAAFFSYYAPFLLVPFLHQARRKVFWLLPGAAFLCFWAATRTFSRGGVIAFVAAMLVTIAISHRKTALALTLAAVLLVTQFSQYLPESLVGRFNLLVRAAPSPGRPFDAKRLDPSAARRLEIWKRALPHVGRNPVFGIGYGTFGGVMRGDAHNGFILICTEMGIPALLIYLLVLWRFALGARYLYRHARSPLLRWLGHGFLACTLAVVVANQFGSRLNSQELSSLFWILGGITLMVEREMRRGNPEFASRAPAPAPARRVSGEVPPVPAEAGLT